MEGKDEIELSLGLSLNGRFGVDPKSRHGVGLKRSASLTSDFMEVARFANAPPQLGRTYSVPVDLEEETRKRKEAQMLRRLVAKRKRCEKQRGGRGSEEERREGVVNAYGDCKGVGFGFKTKGGNGVVARVGGVEARLPPLSQVSTGSSGLSELEGQTPPRAVGMNKSVEAKSPQSVHSYSEQNEYQPVQRSGTTKGSDKIEDGTWINSDLNRSRSLSGTNEMVKNMLVDMPCVWTKGNGVNGTRVEGFLYGYRKGEEVRIVCVCHGSFLTPAEFIKHAGGGDVEHPLRHIVVDPSPFM